MASLKYLMNRRRWQVRWHITCYNQSVLKGSQTFCDKKDALEFKKIVERNSDRFKAGLDCPGESLHIAAQKWFEYNQRRHTERTQAHYKMVLNLFVQSFTITDINQLKAQHIQEYLNKLGGTNRTANAHLTAIKSFCHHLADTYEISNPAATVKMLKEDPPNARFLTPEEYGKVIRFCDKGVLWIIKFIANTGLRATEFCNMTGDWISPDYQQLTVCGKGRKLRIVPLNVTCQKILQKLKPIPNVPLFNFSKNRKLPRRVLYDICLAASKTADIPPFGPHSLRHYCATELLRRGVPIKYVSDLLGHSSIRTTERSYIHFIPADLQGITDVLEGRKSLQSISPPPFYTTPAK